MKVKLERFVNNGWYEYCTYDLAKESDIKAYTEACSMFGKLDYKVRPICIKQVYQVILAKDSEVEE